MAKQPLPQKYRAGPWEIGLGAIEKRPDILLLIGKCVTSWSFVEHQQALLLGFLLQANTNVTVAVYATLKTAPVRRDALTAAAKETLSKEDFELFLAILSIQKTAESHRNDVAHGHWGISNVIADGALWIESRHHSQWNTSVLVTEAKGEGRRPVHAELAENFFLYTKADMEEIHAEINFVWKLFFDFLGMIRERGPKREQQYRQLCGTDRVAEALARIRRDREKTQQAPA